ncbi:class I SAM-dependent methyltransferase [Pleomorphomonas oryzae]|uniref:class I SAM-dependent methyltransferase n=1 Tax=Pleomorphomonas oryzae TaxID=261934 RepID=UPI000A061969|nr:class I SAM-dependent methyltransferase [Pleomorphomonas oryzae]
MDTEFQSENITAQSLDYWNDISNQYDILYDNYWSRTEDRKTQRLLLDHIQNSRATNIVDIGCGGGLGFRLISAVHSGITYTGIDISDGMIRLFKSRHPGVRLICAPATTALTFLEPQSFDYIFSINTSASFMSDTRALLSAIGTALKPNGHFTLSFLNESSLRRVLARERATEEIYRTRGHRTTSTGVHSEVMSESRFSALLPGTGLRVEEIEYHSVLGGVWESRISLILELALSKIAPQLSHEIIFSGVKYE